MDIVKKFQYSRGDHFGKIETVKSESAEYYIFESGRRISKETIFDMMIEINEFSPPFLVEGQERPEEAPMENNSSIDSVLPSPIKTNVDNQTAHIVSMEVPADKPESLAKKILKKSKKKKKIDLVIPFSINILNDDALEFINSTLDVPKKEIDSVILEELNDNINDAIKKFLEKLDSKKSQNSLSANIKKILETQKLSL